MAGTLENKVTGAGAVTDKTAVRFSSATGNLIQSSSVLISDADAISGVTDLTVDNVQIDGDSILHVGDTDNKITFGADTQTLDTGGSSRLDISDSGVRFGAANARITTILDEDAMGTDSATALATQQSIKYYADNLPAELAAKFFYANSLDIITETVSVAGAVISLAVEKLGGGNPNILFSTGMYEFTADSVVLIAGTDEVPVLNYVYILESDKTLTSSTVGWPATEHMAVATVLCQSAASLDTDGPMKNHQWSDDLQEDDDSGHSTSLNAWIRRQNATWESGVAATPTGGAGVFTLSTTSGVVLQMHDHTFPLFAVSSDIYIPNDFTTKFDKITDLKTLLTDASNDSMSGRSFNLVVWGSVSQLDADCKLFINLPTASYSQAASAISDALGSTVFTIPSTYKGTGFLIARLTMSHSVAGGGTWTVSQNEDLRGLNPAVATGSGTGGITSVIDDPSPELGGDLDGGSYNITDAIGSQRTINQVTHTFTGGEVLYLNGAVYEKAKADAVGTSEVVGFVSYVADADNFTIQYGELIATELAGLTPGAVQYLSPTTAGAITETKPTTASQVIKPLMVADTATSAYWNNMLGVLI